MATREAILRPAIMSPSPAEAASAAPDIPTNRDPPPAHVPDGWLAGPVNLVSVDFQNDFVSEGGVHFNQQPCINFVSRTVVPYARERGIPIAEIVSDYRTPGGDAADATCVPGQWGFESAIPSDLKPTAPWVKASIAPTWVRDGGRQAGVIPGAPYADPAGFAHWLETAIGPPSRSGPVVLIGLMLEVCVPASLIEVHMRGYPTSVLIEGVDTADGDARRKGEFLTTLEGYWGKPTGWQQFTDSQH